jgi:type II secretory pathway pseudopilin PulG
MSEKKVVSRNVAIGLGVLVAALLACLGGAIAYSTSVISNKDSQISALSNQNSQLQQQINELQTWLQGNITHLQNQIRDINVSYIQLKQLKYYEVGSSIKISSLEVEVHEWFKITKVRGNITNIGNKPIKVVYVYAFLRNPDETIYFSPDDYEEIKDLYIGETASFEIWIYSYTAGQTVEIWLVY